MTPFIGDACALPLPDGFADFAFALPVVEHLPQTGQFFAEARRILRPGGLLVIATPNAVELGARVMGRGGRGIATRLTFHCKRLPSGVKC
jgi:SAM-dependent methyltransferase